MAAKNKEIMIVDTINKEVERELANPQVMESLIASTFKEFSPAMVKSAIIEARIRGFDFKSILEKDVYPIKYGNGYSLITSITYVRKIAMRSGLAGKSAPTYEYNSDGSISECSITIKRRVGEHVDEYTSTVDFKEYDTGKNQWASKPKTMIAKVAEMHALREAFPEEMSQMFAEEELQKIEVKAEVVVDVEDAETKIKGTNSIPELQKVWRELTAQDRASETIVAMYKEQSRFLKSIIADEVPNESL